MQKLKDSQFPPLFAVFPVKCQISRAPLQRRVFLAGATCGSISLSGFFARFASKSCRDTASMPSIPRLARARQGPAGPHPARPRTGRSALPRTSRERHHERRRPPSSVPPPVPVDFLSDRAGAIIMKEPTLVKASQRVRSLAIDMQLEMAGSYAAQWTQIVPPLATATSIRVPYAGFPPAGANHDPIAERPDATTRRAGRWPAREARPCGRRNGNEHPVAVGLDAALPRMPLAPPSTGTEPLAMFQNHRMKTRHPDAPR